MTTTVDEAARAQAKRYLAALRLELADVPLGRRREVVAGIREHINDAFAGAERIAEGDAVEILNHLGSPRDIADEARSELGLPNYERPGWHEIAAVLFLLLGAPALFVAMGTVTAAAVGWLVGVVLLWSSGTWRTRDKIAGTLLVPLGLGGMIFAERFVRYLSSVAQGQSCFNDGCHTTAGVPDWLTGTIFVTYLVVGLIGPLFTAFWLLRRARRRPGVLTMTTVAA